MLALVDVDGAIDVDVDGAIDVDVDGAIDVAVLAGANGEVERRLLAMLRLLGISTDRVNLVMSDLFGGQLYQGSRRRAFAGWTSTGGRPSANRRRTSSWPATRSTPRPAA